MSAAGTTDPASADQMLKAIRALVPPDAVVEMRIPEYDGRKTNTASGYFDDLEKFVTAARNDDRKAAGVYFTMNRLSLSYWPDGSTDPSSTPS